MGEDLFHPKIDLGRLREKEQYYDHALAENEKAKKILSLDK